VPGFYEHKTNNRNTPHPASHGERIDDRKEGIDRLPSNVGCVYETFKKAPASKLKEATKQNSMFDWPPYLAELLQHPLSIGRRRAFKIFAGKF